MGDSKRLGEVFDEFAEAYDARRSGYPREIVEAAVEIANLQRGSRVLEVGCGTGKLTEKPVEAGLRVDAVDPGRNLVDLARRRVGESNLVRFHLGRFEEVMLPSESYAAVFSATAFHWIEPTAGWRRVASLLEPGGTFALIDAVSVRRGTDTTASDEVLDAFTRLMPGIAHERPKARDRATILAGSAARRDNASELWAWLAHPGRDIAEARTLFGPAVLTTVERENEQTAEELWGVFETTSRYHRLADSIRHELRAETYRIIARHGGTLNSTQLVALVTAQRR